MLRYVRNMLALSLHCPQTWLTPVSIVCVNNAFINIMIPTEKVNLFMNPSLKSSDVLSADGSHSPKRGQIGPAMNFFNATHYHRHHHYHYHQHCYHRHNNLFSFYSHLLLLCSHCNHFLHLSVCFYATLSSYDDEDDYDDDDDDDDDGGDNKSVSFCYFQRWQIDRRSTCVVPSYQ
uniref:Uncharacterized protein n=1 Tax=Glossina pallidipes TaxID=7398 RepID=A0A1B0AE01_GLOPL